MAVTALVSCDAPALKSGNPAPKSERIEHDEHVEYRNYPFNDVMSECAKRAGYMFYRNPELDGKKEYLVTGRIMKDGDDLLKCDDLCGMYGCTRFIKEKTIYALSEEQLKKMPRDKLLWKLRYITTPDVPDTINRIKECFTAIDSKVKYLKEREILEIQGRTDEVAKAEALLDSLDAEFPPEE